MNYFSKVTYQLSPKNRLQEAVQKVFYEEDQKLILSKEAFLKKLQDRVTRLNLNNRRCKPVEVSLWDDRYNREPDRFTISAPDLIQMTLYVVKNPLEVLPKPKRSKKALDPFQLNAFWD